MTLPTDYNPFQSYNIVIPRNFLDKLTRYSRTKTDKGDSKSKEQAPFRRYIDIWVLALLLGRASKSFLNINDIPDRHDFITGTIFARNLDIIQLIFVIAIEREGTHEVVLDSRKSLNIALSYAAGGLPILIDMLESGPGTPLSNLVSGIQDALQDPASLQII